MKRHSWKKFDFGSVSKMRVDGKTWKEIAKSLPETVTTYRLKKACYRRRDDFDFSLGEYVSRPIKVLEAIANDFNSGVDPWKIAFKYDITPANARTIAYRYGT